MKLVVLLVVVAAVLGVDGESFEEFEGRHWGAAVEASVEMIRSSGGFVNDELFELRRVPGKGYGEIAPFSLLAYRILH